MPEIYVHAVEGRNLDQKRALVKDITEAVVKHFKVKPEAVMVQIMESPKIRGHGRFLFSDRPRANCRSTRYLQDRLPGGRADLPKRCAPSVAAFSPPLPR